jgi:hypothetical protein
MPSASGYTWTITEQAMNGEAVYAWVVTDPSGRRMTAGTERTRGAASLAAARSVRNLEKTRNTFGERS